MAMPAISFAAFVILILAAIALIAIPVGIVVAISMALRRQSGTSANPNLFPCPDCQKLISIQATACPNCGRSVKST